MSHKIFGLENFKEVWLDIGVYNTMGLIGGVFYHYIFGALVNLNQDQIKNMSRIM